MREKSSKTNASSSSTALGNHNNTTSQLSDDCTNLDDDRNTESIEELKQSIMGRQIKSMYDIDHNSEAQLANGMKSTLTKGKPTLNSTTTAVANELRNEFDVPGNFQNFFHFAVGPELSCTTST